MNAIERLRRDHMAEEERELFPLLERTLAGCAAAEAPAQTAQPFDETMTINRIVSQFPRTRPIFERLFINVPIEGCTCLDEAAWRHGMDAEELLHLLEGAVEACGCELKEPAAIEPEVAGSAVTAGGTN